MSAMALAGAKLWLPSTGNLDIGDTVRIRIRARDVSLALTRVEGLSIRNQIPATVAAIETDGSPFAEVKLDCGGQALRARISRLAVDDLALAPGQQLVALIKSVAFDRRLSRL